MSLPTPNNRKETYLNAIATGGTENLPTPITREEQYLDAIAKSGGGGSGDGDMKKSVYDSDLAVANAGGIKAFVSNAVSGKVDKVEGKGLSTNDYSDTEKGKVADNASAIEALSDTMAANGAHNLFFETKYYDGGLLTKNDDGTYSVASGTVSEWLEVGSNKKLIPNTKYVFSIGDSACSGLELQVYSITKNVYTLIASTHIDKSIEFTTLSSFDIMYIRVKAEGGFNTSAGIISPMIRLASDPSTEYTPYAMTNRELTERVMVLTQRIDPVISVNALKWTADILNVPSGYIPLSIEWSADVGYSAAAIFNTYMQNNNYYYLIFNPSNDTNYTYKGTMSILCVKS